MPSGQRGSRSVCQHTSAFSKAASIATGAVEEMVEDAVDKVQDPTPAKFTLSETLRAGKDSSEAHPGETDEQRRVRERAERKQAQEAKRASRKQVR